MIDSSSVLPDDELERLERELERDIQGLESPSHSVYAHSQPQNQQNNNLFTIEPGTSFSFGLDSFSHQNNQPNQINTSTNQDSISFIGSQLDDLSLRSQQRIAALNSSTNTSTKQYDDSATNIRKSIEKLLQEPLKHVSPSNRSSAPLTPKHHPIITVTTQSTPRTSINSLNNNLDSRPRDAMGILSSSPTTSHQHLASSDRFVNAAPLPTYERGRSIQSSFSSVQKSGNAAANSFSQDRTPQQQSARSSSVGLSTVSPKRTLSGSRNMKEQTHTQQLVQSGTANRSNSNIFKPSSSGSQPTPSSYQHNPSFQKLLPKSPEKDHISSTGDLKSRRSLNSTAANASSMTTINNPHEQNFGTRPTHNKQAPKQAQTQQLQQQQQTPKRVEDDISDRLDALIADELANVEMILDSAHTSLTPSPVSMKTNNQTGYQPFNNRPKPLSIASRGASLSQSRKNLPQQQGFGSSPVPTAVESRQRDDNENRSRAVSISPSRAELIEEAQRLVGSGRDVSRERAEQTGYESRKKPEERSREISMSTSRVKLVEEAPRFVVRGRGESKDRERNPTSSMGSLTKGLEDRGRDGSIQNRSRSVSMSPSRAELVEEAQRFVGRGRELSRERESSREGSRVSLTSQCRFDDGHNGRVVVDNVSKQQQQSQRNGEDDERRERLARLARLHTREQIKSTVPVESGAENRGEQLARLANLHNRSPSTKDFTGQQPITQNDIKPPQTNRSIQGSRSILSPEKSTIPNSQRPTIESLRVQEWKKGRVDTESKTSLKSQPQDFAKSVSASREAVTYGAASNSGSRHALNAGGRQSRSVTPPIVEQATRLSATDGLNVQSSRTSSRSPSRITLSPDYDFRIGSDERESRNAAPPSEYASRAHSRSSSRHALNNQRPPSRTMSRSPSRPTLSPDYDVRPGAEMREALHAGPPPPNDVPTSRQHSRSPSRQQINDPSPMQHQPRESMGKTASLSYMSSVKSDSVTQFGSVGYMSAQVSAGNLAKSHSYSEPTLSSHGNSREGGSGAWHFERRESIREQFGAMEEQRAHSMNVQITKQAQIDTNKLQPVLPASGITRSKSPVGSGRLRSSSPLREAFGIHDQSEPEHFAEPSPIRSENTLSESAKNYQDIVDEVKKPPMFEKPPLPPSIRTSSNDLKPSKVSIEQLGVNSSVSRQSSFNSLHSAHLTPNLANLANPQGKASLMNLHDQGPAIIPSVVDKVEDGIQRRPVAHLPVDEGSRAVVNALRTLQEKVSKLEGEKENAKSVIQNLESDLVTTRQLLQHERSRVNSTVNSSVRETPSIPAASLPQQASPTSASSSHVHYENHEVDDFDFSRKIALEAELQSTKRKAFILERQLDRFRDLQHLTAAERDEAILELNLLKDEIRLGESKLSAISRSNNRSPLRARSKSPRPLSPKKQPQWLHPEQRNYGEDTGEEGDKEDSESTRIPTQRSHSPSPRATRARTPSPRRHTPPQYVEQQASSSTEESFLEKEDIQGLLSEIEFVRKRGKDGHMRVVATARPPVEGTIGVRKLTSGKERKGSAVPTTTRNNAPSGVNESAQFVQDPHWKRIDPSRPPIPLPHQNTTHPAKSPSHNRSLSRNRPKSAEREYARDMPFIVGTSTNKSHSVTANLQTVYALLKAHNPALCSVCTQRRKKAADSARSRSPSHSRSGSSRNFDNEDHAHHHRKIAEVGSGLAETDKLKSVLGTLQNDFNRLKLHYQSLVQYYDSVSEDIAKTKRNHSVKADRARLHEIGKELKEVIQTMESKGDQISILREIITSTAADVAIRVKSKVGSVKPPKSPKGPRLRSSTPHSYEAHQSQFLGLSRKHHQHDSTYESNYGVESKIDDLEEYAVRGRKPSTESRSRQESNRIGGGSASGRSMSPAKQAASLTLLRSSMKVQRVFGDVMK